MQTDRTQDLLNRTEGRLWLADGGLETTLIFLDGIDLPHFASFPLLDDDGGRQAMRRYFDHFMDDAEQLGAGFMLDTATWRANDGWGAIMGLAPAEIDAANRKGVAFAQELRDGRRGRLDIVINGVCGPHGDGYRPDRLLSADEAHDYYRPNVRALAEAGADMISAITMSDVGPAIGVARAAAEMALPAVISFTVETDGRLVTGMDLADAIAETDAATGAYPAWYMINCAHPTHFRDRLQGDWVTRVGGLRANASRKSHAELDEATELDAGDIDELAGDYAALKRLLPKLRVVGGCCGTDHRHVAAIGRTCLGHAPA